VKSAENSPQFPKGNRIVWVIYATEYAIERLTADRESWQIFKARVRGADGTTVTMTASKS
jgi:hypothetical protein